MRVGEGFAVVTEEENVLDPTRPQSLGASLRFGFGGETRDAIAPVIVAPT